MKILLGTVGTIAGIFILIFVFIGFKAVNNTMSNKDVQIPNIVGMKLEDAKKQLANVNLVLVEAGTEVSSEPEGTILQINPKAGTSVKEKSEVRVITSSGATKLKMPDLKEYDINTAKTILSSLGLKIDTTTEEYSDNVAKGQIISQNPAPDTEITTSEKITVVISKGPEIKLTTVPDVINKNVNEAKDILTKANLKVSIQERETSKESENEIVLDQSISGSRVEYGTTVIITVGKHIKQQEPTIPPTNNSTKPGGTNNDNKPNSGTTPGEAEDKDENINEPSGPSDEENNTTAPTSVVQQSAKTPTKKK